MQTRQYRRTFNQFRDWLHRQIAPLSNGSGRENISQRWRFNRRFLLACVLIFLTATSVRLLHWQDSHGFVADGSLPQRYIRHAQRILNGDGLLYPRDYQDAGNAQLLIHPPGYSLFIAGVYRLFGESDGAVTLVQLLLDSLAAVMVALIAGEFLSTALSILAGFLIAFSPHFAYHSLMIMPDSLAVLPILCAIFFAVKSIKRPRYPPVVAAGFFIGISCWLRSNAMLLAVFVALLLWLTVKGHNGLRYALALIATTVIAISPITIRNWVVFGQFIPLSLGAGITLVEGIGEYDSTNQYSMPASDGEVKLKDAEWHNRPDYATSNWNPDGVFRDRYRFRRGLEVVRTHPLWFAGVMMRRAGSMLRYNSRVPDLAYAPIVSAEPTFSHQLSLPAEAQPVWTYTADSFQTSGKIIASRAEEALTADGRRLIVKGDSSDYGDQMMLAAIPVEMNTDYVLKFQSRLLQGPMAAKITSGDRRLTLAYVFIENSEKRVKKPGQDSSADDIDMQKSNPEPDDTVSEASEFVIPFASGNRREVSLVISNNGESAERRSVEIGQAELYQVGTTSAAWAGAGRRLIRGIQRNLYTTSFMLPTFVLGILILTLAGHKNALLTLLCVPVYYLLMQSAFHTEYRYILAIHYFLFIMAATAIYILGKLLGKGVARIIKNSRRDSQAVV